MNPRTLWFAISLATAFVTQAAPTPPTIEPLRAVFIQGTAKLNTNETLISAGQTFKNGDTVKTGANTYLDLEGMDFSLRMNPGTELHIDEFEHDSIRKAINIRLKIQSGSVLCNVKRLAALSKIQMNYPQGTVGVRGSGTSFCLSTDGTSYVAKGVIETTYLPANMLHAVDGAPAVRSGFSFKPPTKGESDCIFRTPRDFARALESDLEDLKKHRVPKPR